MSSRSGCGGNGRDKKILVRRATTPHCLHIVASLCRKKSVAATAERLHEKNFSTLAFRPKHELRFHLLASTLLNVSIEMFNTGARNVDSGVSYEDNDKDRRDVFGGVAFHRLG